MSFGGLVLAGDGLLVLWKFQGPTLVSKGASAKKSELTRPHERSGSLTWAVQRQSFEPRNDLRVCVLYCTLGLHLGNY